jgi:tRNA(Ile)-lysidine synthase
LQKAIGMLEEFSRFIESNSLCKPTDRILLAISGGIDSMVLLHLYFSAGYKPGIAHCNFHLRGAESDEDEKFVRSAADRMDADFHRQDFDTEQTAFESGISIQMAARNLRYRWFEKIRKKYGYNFIATAHNQDDVIETFFINLSRGTGIRGLTGIPVRSEKVIRPLLFASRESIVEYATEHDIRFREDSSNASDKYLRNRIRHHLIPLLEEENPSFRNALIDTMHKLLETEKLYAQELVHLKHRLVHTEGDRSRISIRDLSANDARRSILFEILAEYNFSSQAMEAINHSLEGPSGKQFLSATHRVVKDREDLIITPLDREEKRKYYLEQEAGRITEPFGLEWMVVDHTVTFHIPKDPKIACLDLQKLHFPLILRQWRSGDYFQPLGMQGMKKISDFLIDIKVSLPDKERTWLLTSGSKIVWVIGQRIDDRFKVMPETRQVLMMKFNSPFPSEL